jgi:hypothetical protein
MAFVVGALAALAWFGYTVVYRYRNLAFKHGETRSDRLVRVLRKVAWRRIPVFCAAMGATAYLLWHGMDDTLAGWWP